MVMTLLKSSIISSCINFDTNTRILFVIKNVIPSRIEVSRQRLIHDGGVGAARRQKFWIPADFLMTYRFSKSVNHSQGRSDAPGRRVKKCSNIVCFKNG